MKFTKGLLSTMFQNSDLFTTLKRFKHESKFESFDKQIFGPSLIILVPSNHLHITWEAQVWKEAACVSCRVALKPQNLSSFPTEASSACSGTDFKGGVDFLRNINTGCSVKNGTKLLSLMCRSKIKPWHSTSRGSQKLIFTLLHIWSLPLNSCRS